MYSDSAGLDITDVPDAPPKSDRFKHTPLILTSEWGGGAKWHAVISVIIVVRVVLFSGGIQPLTADIFCETEEQEKRMHTPPPFSPKQGGGMHRNAHGPDGASPD
jgi:hypothetical protein